nr:TRAP transporter small permease [Salinicola sp. S1-1-2]
MDGLARLCLIVAGVLLVFLILSFGWLVFGRYVLNDTPTWIEQSSLLIVVYITCLGAAAGVRFNSHLSIDFLREGAPRIPRIVMHAIADGFVLLFGAFMAWQGWLMVMNNVGRPIPMLGLSESWRALPLVICGGLMVVFTVANLLQRMLRSGRAGS